MCSRLTNVLDDTGSRVTHLGSDMRKKLKDAYTLIEQLYTGAQRVICTTSHNTLAQTLIKDTWDKLSMLPAQIKELKKSAARAGALTALTRAKAWQADLDPEDLANGCPSVKEDGTPFSADDFADIVRSMHPLATRLAEETKLSQYQAAYDVDNKKVKAPIHQETDLIPPIRKHTFAPDIDPSDHLDDEAVFRYLTVINWSTPDFQPEIEEAQDDLEASTRQE